MRAETPAGKSLSSPFCSIQAPCQTSSGDAADNFSGEKLPLYILLGSVKETLIEMHQGEVTFQAVRSGVWQSDSFLLVKFEEVILVRCESMS